MNHRKLILRFVLFRVFPFLVAPHFERVGLFFLALLRVYAIVMVVIRSGECEVGLFTVDFFYFSGDFQNPPHDKVLGLLVRNQLNFLIDNIQLVMLQDVHDDQF